MRSSSSLVIRIALFYDTLWNDTAPRHSKARKNVKTSLSRRQRNEQVPSLKSGSCTYIVFHQVIRGRQKVYQQWSYFGEYVFLGSTACQQTDRQQARQTESIIRPSLLVYRLCIAGECNACQHNGRHQVLACCMLQAPPADEPL